MLKVDSGSDLNAYAKAENTSGCCSPAETAPVQIGGAPVAEVATGCCIPAATTPADEALHNQLTDLLRKYDVNEYAASVKIFAVKPKEAAAA